MLEVAVPLYGSLRLFFPKLSTVWPSALQWSDIN